MQIEISTKRLKTLSRQLRKKLDLNATQGRQVLDALAHGLGYKSHGALKTAIAAAETAPLGPALRQMPGALQAILSAHPTPWAPRFDPDDQTYWVVDAGGKPVEDLDRLIGLNDHGSLRRFVTGVNRAALADQMRAAGHTVDDALDFLRAAGLVAIAVDAHDVASYLASDSTEDGDPGDREMQRAAAWFADPDNRARLEHRLGVKLHSVLEDVAATIPDTPILGYQLRHPERGLVSSEEAPLPWTLTSYEILCGAAIETARAWADHAGYTLAPIHAGDVEEPTFIDWLPPAAA